MHWPPDPQMRNPAAANGRVLFASQKASAGSLIVHYHFGFSEASILEISSALAR
jgi:hypothetical protein